ncbi:hypothetical protein [Streptomyces achromogenes]|uniref:hypothetical protein n=1 Tax=Streptomyces achromogenes TaxID=67255 RepID=UPI003698CE17
MTHPYGGLNVDGKCCICGITREELDKPEPSANDKCRCGHIRFRHQREDSEDTHCAIPSCKCTAFEAEPASHECDNCNGYDPSTCLFNRPAEPEPSMTPEEEEQAPEDTEIPTDDFGQPIRECWTCDRVGCKGCPPQPERRPPLTVAYSVQGHLYEVALSGDATVRAVDGALVITHALGPVAGIVQTAPLPGGGQG